MGRDVEKPLAGAVEIDDTYWVGKKKRKHGRGSKTQSYFLLPLKRTVKITRC